MSLDEKTTKRIRVGVIIEVLGRPPEHLIEALENVVKQIGEEKGMEIKEHKIKEPTLIKDQKDLYTSFVDLEIELEEIFSVVILMFKYMPAHIEIIEPERISIQNNDLNTLFNELARRLHGFDEVARVLQSEKAILEKKLKEILGKLKQEKEFKSS